MTTDSSITRDAYERPRLVPAPGLRTVRVYAEYGTDVLSAYAVHWSDGTTDAYLGAVYRHGRTEWSAFRAVGQSGAMADRLVRPSVGHRFDYASKRDAVAAILDAAGITA